MNDIDRLNTAIKVLQTHCALHEENERLALEKLAKVRKHFKRYAKSEGCSCCRDDDVHTKAANKLGKLLGFEKYPGPHDNYGTNYDFYEREKD